MHIVCTLRMCAWTHITVSSCMRHFLFVSTVHDNSVSFLQHWSNISVDHSVEWPLVRSSHSATLLSGSKFVIVGGQSQFASQSQLVKLLNDMWVCDTTSKLWTKVTLLLLHMRNTCIVLQINVANRMHAYDINNAKVKSNRIMHNHACST